MVVCRLTNAADGRSEKPIREWMKWLYTIGLLAWLWFTVHERLYIAYKVMKRKCTSKCKCPSRSGRINSVFSLIFRDSGQLLRWFVGQIDECADGRSEKPIREWLKLKPKVKVMAFGLDSLKVLYYIQSGRESANVSRSCQINSPN